MASVVLLVIVIVVILVLRKRSSGQTKDENKQGNANSGYVQLYNVATFKHKIALTYANINIEIICWDQDPTQINGTQVLCLKNLTLCFGCLTDMYGEYKSISASLQLLIVNDSATKDRSMYSNFKLVQSLFQLTIVTET